MADDGRHLKVTTELALDAELVAYHYHYHTGDAWKCEACGHIWHWAILKGVTNANR